MIEYQYVVLEGVWRASRLCLEGVWRVSEECLESVWKLYHIWKYHETVFKVYAGYFYVWTGS